MKVVIQRVIKSSVIVNKKVIGKIENGLNILLAIKEDDSVDEIKWLVEKILNLRVFNDLDGKMNKSIKDIQGELLVISQFTLYGNCRKGTRPSYSKAAKPEKAKEFYEIFVKSIKEKSNLKVEQGIFGANMEVNIVNDGPVTLIIDTKQTRKGQ